MGRLAVLLGAGVVGAVALPVWRTGVGWAIAGLALVGAVAALWGATAVKSGPTLDGGAARERGTAPTSGTADESGTAPTNGTGGASPADRVWRACAVAAAVALVAVSVVRAAGWFVALCLLVAVPLAASGLGGGRGWLGLGRGVATLPRATWPRSRGSRSSVSCAARR